MRLKLQLMVERWVDNFCFIIAYHCVPRKLLYWCVIRAFAMASKKYSKQTTTLIQFHHVTNAVLYED